MALWSPPQRGFPPEWRGMISSLRGWLGRLDGDRSLVTVTASGSARQLDMRYGFFDITLTANCTLTFTGTPEEWVAHRHILLRQDGTGSRTVTWPSSVKWPSGTAPTLSTTANRRDLIRLHSPDAGTTWYGQLVGTHMS